jgi:hypothetical protein
MQTVPDPTKKRSTNEIRKREEAERKFNEKKQKIFDECYKKTKVHAKCWSCAEVISKDLDGYVSEEELQPFANYFKKRNIKIKS